jgi:heme/copper-type cytochrome/quinol oxidase subunit 2
MKLFIPLAIVIVVTLVVMIYVYVDYRRHKKPLTSVDPNVNYSLFHHIAVVTIPIFRYRLSIRLSKINPNNPKGVHKF